jgi:tRNA (Thr-GGU) A37 N-methylase
MALTENQKANIQKLSINNCIEILDECKERLGLVSQIEYIKIVAYKHTRQNLNNDLKSGKIKNWLFCGIRYPIINDK